MRKINIILILSLTFLVQFAFGQKQVTDESITLNSETRLSLDPNVRTGELKNGFRYFIRQNTTPKGKAVFYFANKVGSILETEEQLGLAHFMEHMNFNGTKSFPKNQLVDYLQTAGIRFGADLNAYTSFDETIYQLPIPTDDPELIENTFKIIRGWAGEALLDHDEIDKERGIILEEKRGLKSVEQRMQEQYFPLLLNHSRYAARIPIGTEEVLINFKPQEIENFYRDWYRPDLQALIIVGDIDVDDMEEKIKKEFSSLKQRGKNTPRQSYKIPLTGKNQFIALTDAEQTAVQWQMIFKHPKLELLTVGDYQTHLSHIILNMLLAQRYAQARLIPNSAMLQGTAGINKFMANVDAFTVSSSLKQGEIEAGVKDTWREIVRLKKFGFTEAELSRAKENHLKSLDGLLKEMNKTSSETYAKEYVQYFTNDEASPGIEKEQQLSKAALAKIQLADLHALLDELTQNANRDIILLAPENVKSALPTEESIYAWLQQVEDEDLEQQVENTTDKKILSSLPPAGKIVAEEYNPELNFTTLTLSNGLKVVLKPTDFKSDEILFTAFAQGGTSLYSDADYQSAANVASLVLSSGIGNLDINELTKLLTAKKARVNPYISSIFQGVTGTTGEEDLETALELTHAYFTQPRKDQVAFKKVIDLAYASIANRENDPKSVFQDSMLSTVYSYNFRMSGPSIEKLARIDLDRAYEIYKERFEDASNFTFVFVGSLDTVVLKPLIEKYLGSLTALNKNEQFQDLNISPAKGRITKNIYKGKEDKATVSLILGGDWAYSREVNLNLTALKEILQIRVLERLREEESGVYSPQVSFSSGKYPSPIYQYSIAFTCAPENVDNLIASALDEIEELKITGPSQINLEKFKTEFKRTLEANSQTNNYWLSLISTCLQQDIPFRSMEESLKQLETLTPSSLQQVAQTYLTGENLIRMVLLPEK
ncbi:MULTISPECIES: M16 family metallopeptidase [Sphingobacterium]|uniref:M16 family metallopeptidase n=1 Tax=Sphingobacterium populi TaxID=1812824 RepID=A0ABW5UEK3_9SPHI|nr:M16 family metallopeptidase [Sphingobacterium sp. CFCC 11742]